MIPFIYLVLLFLIVFQTYSWISNRNEISDLREDATSLLNLTDTQHEINTAIYLIAEGLTKRAGVLESDTIVLSELYAILTKRIDELQQATKTQDERVHDLERAMKAVCESGGLYPLGFNPLPRKQPDISGQKFYDDITKPEREKDFESKKEKEFWLKEGSGQYVRKPEEK